MKVIIDAMAIDAIDSIIKEQNTDDTDVRIYLAGMGWAGPSFGLALDKQADDDFVDDSTKLKFVMEKELYERFGDILIESVGEGFRVIPADDSLMGGCGSCGGGCH